MNYDFIEDDDEEQDDEPRSVEELEELRGIPGVHPDPEPDMRHIEAEVEELEAELAEEMEHPMDGPKDPGGLPASREDFVWGNEEPDRLTSNAYENLEKAPPSPDSKPCVTDIMAPWVYLEDDDRHDHHWHRYGPDHEDFMSVWVEHKEWGEWWVEVFPSPKYDHDREHRTGHDTREEAIQRVVEVMEENP